MNGNNSSPFSLSALIFLVPAFLLTASIVSVDLFDPTFFHQLRPTGGISNWLGLPGALIGGTLVELLGVAALIIPWFLARPVLLAKKQHSTARVSFNALVLTMALCASTAKLWPATSAPDIRPSLLISGGYIGDIGVNWLLDLFGYGFTIMLLLLVMIISTVKIFDELPIRATLKALAFVIILPIMAFGFFRTEIAPRIGDWMAKISNFLRENLPTQLGEGDSSLGFDMPPRSGPPPAPDAPLADSGVETAGASNSGDFGEPTR